MEFNKHKTNKFIKKSEIDNNEIPNTENKKLLTNIEAFQLGEFPDHLLEKVNLPVMSRENYIDDVKNMILPVLRHRIIPSFNAEADGISRDDIISSLIKNNEK